MELAGPPLSEENTEPAAFSPTPTQESGMIPLPAYALPGEMIPGGKGDAASDWKEAHPEWYNITEPPTNVEFRHMREWEDMQAMLMVYPGYAASDPVVTRIFTDIVRHTTPVSDVWIVFYSSTSKQKLTTSLEEAGVNMDKVHWKFIKNDAIWTIDFGPFPLVNTTDNSVAFLDWKYYPGRYNDDAISTILGQDIGVTVYRQDVGFEGGSFQGDGYNNCYSTQRSLTHTGLSEADFEASFKEYTNCQDMHIVKDITDDGTGHIDMFFKLHAENAAVLGYYPDALGDPVNQQRMDDNEDQLKAIAMADGNPMTVVRVPMPGYGKNANGTVSKTPFTYINSTLINGRNLWPYTNLETYPEWQASFDEAAMAWYEAMPDYEHIAIETEALNWASGAIHCITRTIPNGAFSKWVPDGTCDGGTCSPAAGFEDTAYNGECVGTAQNECFGPKWVEPAADACEGYTYEGCCDGDVLTYCENNEIKTGNCDPGTCGWASGGWYDCKTDGGSDPSNTHPRSCEELTNPCVPQCADKTCGDNGCGGTCGTCTEEQVCNDTGQCEAVAPPCIDACEADSLGCSDDSTAPWSCTLNESTGCYEMTAQTACGEGTACTDGSCAATSQSGKSGGCAVSETGGGTFLPTLVLGFALLMLMTRRRFGQQG